MKRNRRGKLVVAAEVKLDRGTSQVDWSKCCICQKDARNVVCPANNPVGGTKGYETVASNLDKLRPLNYTLECGYSVNELDEGEGILRVFENKKAKWHKTCVRPFQPQTVNTLVNRLKQEGTLQNAEASSSSAGAQLPGPPSTRSSTPTINVKDEVCFLCTMPGSWSTPLHRCETQEIYQNIKKAAKSVGEWRTLGILITDGDLIAQEAKYHAKCLVRIYNQARRAECKDDRDREVMACEGMAFADLLIFIQSKLDESPDYVFQMGKLMKQYQERIDQLLDLPLGSTKHMHTTRTRMKILAHFPQLKALKSGREYVLMRDGANILRNIDAEDQDEDALGFYRFIKTLRKVLSSAKVKFSGSFEEGCEKKSVPAMLLAVVNSIEFGSSVGNESGATIPILKLAQLMFFNFKEKVPKGDIVRLNKEKETPFPLYLGLSLYAGARDKTRIDEMHRAGLSVSSNRVMEVTSQFCRLTVKRAEEEGVLCPPNLKKGLLTVGGLDNVDLKSRSTTAKGEFHGTGISYMQIPERNQKGTERTFQTNFEDVEQRGCRSVPELPDKYCYVQEVLLPHPQPRNTRCTPDIAATLLEINDPMSNWKKERDWLQHTHDLLTNDEQADNISFSAYYASQTSEASEPAIVGGMAPLYEDKSNSVSMIRHGMDNLREVTDFLNPGQIPILCMDLPLFVIEKYIQWSWPVLYGEDKFVLLLGPLHIEQSFLRTIGQFMERSGWSSLMSVAGVTTPGSAEADLKVTHITRARLMHQITAAALHSLLMDAYDQYVEDCDFEGQKELSLDEWIEEKSEQPLFKYWLIVLNLEIVLLTFVRSVRKGDFMLFKESIRSMLPWYLQFDHQPYGRWLSVHLKDLEELPVKAPSIHDEFMKGKFVISDTPRKFSSIGIDHKHEQCNALIKSKHGVVGLTQDRSAMLRVMISGPQISQLLAEFEGEQEDTSGLSLHHEQYPAFQKTFLNNFVALKQAFIDHENPYAFKGSELIALDTRIALNENVVECLKTLANRALGMYEDFVKIRLLSEEGNFYDVMKKAQLEFFAQKNMSKKKTAKRTLKSENELFWRLFAASLARKLNLSHFFQYENQKAPPVFSVNGKMRTGEKADLVRNVLEPLIPKGTPGPTICDSVVIDGAMVIHCNPPNAGEKSFIDYFAKQVKRFIQGVAKNVKASNVAIAWDLYHSLSVKAFTREERGPGVRMPDLPEKGQIPNQKDWKLYTANPHNKMELFKFLAEGALQQLVELSIVTNVNEIIRASGSGCQTDLDSMNCINAEEADGRILLHVNDMVCNGARSVLIRSTDTDVVVLAVSYYWELKAKGLIDLWVQFGFGAKGRYLPIHVIASVLGEEKSVATRGFHAFTGCDSVSYFSGKKKISCYKTWTEFEDVTEAFRLLGTPSKEFPESVMPILERYTVLLYDKNSELTSVDAAREALFVGENRPLTLIPPTSSALQMHAERAFYEAGQIWGNCLTLLDEPPSPCKWGWKLENGQLEPIWTSKPDLWSAVRDLDRCGCKRKPCDTRMCPCQKSGLHCCPACKCKTDFCQNKSKPNETDQATQQPRDGESDQDHSS